ncbi:MAG: carbamoyltransferase HypF [Candidatus Zixiibacteriota bacterium]
MQITDNIKNVKIEISGKVQGVGFRPFIYNLARQSQLNGYVANTANGVVIEITGSEDLIDGFVNSMQQNRPPLSQINNLTINESASGTYNSFTITDSIESVNGSISIIPDIAICQDCLDDILDSKNRRFRYPFTNCTSCGPRYSIIESLPYDRANTAMKTFQMCEQCRAEYENPADRRFHAQPIACPNCGPNLELWDNSGKFLGSNKDIIERSAEFLKAGKILALKGLGGFQLLVNALDEDAVQLLRKRKHRERKPLALMVRNVQELKLYCKPTDDEIELLRSMQSPIVIIRKRKSNSSIAPNVAPNNSTIGIMLPYTPLHHLLMREIVFPAVCTSGNISNESIIIDERAAVNSLGSIADYFLVHNRPIVRPVDDSVVRLIAGKPSVIRSARGYAPAEFEVEHEGESILATGTDLKNTIAVKSGNKCIVSQHIGDLRAKQTFDLYHNTINSLSSLYRLHPDLIITDLHPDYLSSSYANPLNRPSMSVQHHYAHLFSCMLDNNLKPPVLGIVWDGTGLGEDNSIWGGEFLAVDDTQIKRMGHLKQFMLPGGDMPAREPRRSAIAILHDIYGNGAFSLSDCHAIAAFNKDELPIIRKMLRQKINCHLTSSMGRLFDAVSSLLDLCQKSDYEAEAAIALESVIGSLLTEESYDFEVDTIKNTYIVNWHPIIKSVLNDLRDNIKPETISGKFHNTLAEIILTVAKLTGIKQVALTGGCFQNKYLTERAIIRLRQENFKPFRHQRIPTNDGGISAGQIMAGVHLSKKD